MSFHALSVIALFLGACATPGGENPAPANPIDMQRGWKIYVHGAGDALVGITTLPQYPADTTRPNQILDSIAGAFCVPIRDEKNGAAGEQERDFCERSADAPARVVLAPGWNDDVPPYQGCFIHCVCEGRAPRTDDPSETARESESGPCTNRLNCRLDCPQP